MADENGAPIARASIRTNRDRQPKQPTRATVQQTESRYRSPKPISSRTRNNHPLPAQERLSGPEQYAPEQALVHGSARDPKRTLRSFASMNFPEPFAHNMFATSTMPSGHKPLPKGKWFLDDEFNAMAAKFQWDSNGWLVLESPGVKVVPRKGIPSIQVAQEGHTESPARVSMQPPRSVMPYSASRVPTVPDPPGQQRDSLVGPSSVGGLHASQPQSSSQAPRQPETQLATEVSRAYSGDFLPLGTRVVERPLKSKQPLAHPNSPPCTYEPALEAPSTSLKRPASSMEAESKPEDPPESSAPKKHKVYVSKTMQLAGLVRNRHDEWQKRRQDNGRDDGAPSQ